MCQPCKTALYLSCVLDSTSNCLFLPPALVVEVTCWYNQALPIGHNVSAACHARFQGRPAVCDLCQLDVMISQQRHQLPGACSAISEPHGISIALEHKGHVRCVLKCQGNASHNCNVTVTGGSKYDRIWCHRMTVNAFDLFPCTRFIDPTTGKKNKRENAYCIYNTWVLITMSSIVKQ